MKQLENLILICNKFREGKFEIKEFQSRISTALIPDAVSTEFLSALKSFDAELEKIIYCYDSTMYREKGLLAAEKLCHAIALEKARYSS